MIEPETVARDWEAELLAAQWRLLPVELTAREVSLIVTSLPTTGEAHALADRFEVAMREAGLWRAFAP